MPRYQYGPLGQKIRSVRGLIATDAQAVYDQWNQDEEGIDEEFGAGGICDQINRCIQSRLGEIEHDGLNYYDGGQDGDDHAFTIAHDDTEAYQVDIPHSVYEEGAGYSWRKVPGVQFTEDNVTVDPIPHEWVEGGDDTDDDY